MGSGDDAIDRLMTAVHRRMALPLARQMSRALRKEVLYTGIGKTVTAYLETHPGALQAAITEAATAWQVTERTVWKAWSVWKITEAK
jgi:hypothetical protein